MTPYDSRPDEEFVLGNILAWPASCHWEIAELEPRLFTVPEQRTIAGVVCRLRDQGQIIGRRRVMARLGKGTRSAAEAERLFRETSLDVGVGRAMARLKQKCRR